jgi:HSP20 family protein
METNSPNGGRQSEATRRAAPTPQAQNEPVSQDIDRQNADRQNADRQNADRQPQQAASGGVQRSGGTGSQGSQDRSRTMSTRGAGDLSRSSGAHSPFHTMSRLSREMDQLFDSFFGNRFGFPRLSRGWPFESGGMGMGGDDLSSLWSPNVDVRRRGDSVVVHAELPGIPKDAVRIEATDQGIAISGERNETREEGGTERGYQLKERSYGSFYREIPLPEGAQVEQAKATMREGVLEITVPLQQNQSRRSIQIE